ncbi:MAG: sensor histidine kinase, partial [bacterium]
SVIAHELKSPFQALIGFSELLAEELKNSDNDYKSYANIILDTSRNTYQLLESLIEWGKSSQNDKPVKLTRLNLAQQVNDCIVLLDSMASLKNIRIVSCISDDIFVFTDKSMLLTILRNLVSNALKFSRNDSKVFIRSNPYIDEEGRTEIIVEDSGTGMSESLVKSLFKENIFHSINGTNGEKGSGLGLYICKEFLRKLHGEISVSSELGKGTMISFFLPSIPFSARKPNPVKNERIIHYKMY